MPTLPIKAWEFGRGVFIPPQKKGYKVGACHTDISPSGVLICQHKYTQVFGFYSPMKPKQ